MALMWLLFVVRMASASEAATMVVMPAGDFSRQRGLTYKTVVRISSNTVVRI
jgi:hypothetical protein